MTLLGRLIGRGGSSTGMHLVANHATCNSKRALSGQHIRSRRIYETAVKYHFPIAWMRWAYFLTSYKSISADFMHTNNEDGIICLVCGSGLEFPSL